MRKLVPVALAAALAAAVSSGTAPASSRQPRALFFGDSLIEGVGTVPRGPVLAWTASGLLHWTAVVDGWGGTGYTTGGRHGRTYADRLRRDGSLRQSYDVVVLEGGTNDARYGSLPDLRQAALAVVDQVRRAQPRARIVLLGVWAPPQTDQTRYRRADRVLRGVAASRGLTYVTQLGLHGPDLLASDGYHPSTASYVRMGTALAATLAPQASPTPQRGR